MYGNQGMEIAVGTQAQADADDIKVLWNITGNQGNEWREKTLTVNEENNQAYRIIFAVFRVADDNDVAFDDISFTVGACADESKKDVLDASVKKEADETEDLVKTLLKKKKGIKTKKLSLPHPSTV